MAQVPCAPVPDTGRQGTIEVLKYVILLPWHAKPRNPTEVVHVWTTIPSLDHNPSPSVVAFPPIRPSVPAWRIKRLARSPAGMYGPLLHKVQAERLPGKASISNPRTRVRLHHSRVLLRLTGTPPHRRRGSIVPASPSPCVEHLWIFRVGPWILRFASRSHLPHLSGTRSIIETVGGRCHCLHARPLRCFTADTGS